MPFRNASEFPFLSAHFVDAMASSWRETFSHAAVHTINKA